MLGAYLGRVDDGVRVADLAAAKLVRIGGDATAEAALLTARAYLHLNRGEVAPAIADAERALALRRQTEGGDSPGIARALANLGDLVAWGGDLRRALELQQEASAMVEHSLGSAHPMFAGMLHSVAVSERETGRYTEALAHFDREIALLRETLGDAHGSTATALMNRAMTWFEIDRFAEAETDVRSSLAAFGGASEDADSVYGQSLLAAIQRSRGRWEESLLSATRALEAGQRLWGRDHYFLVQFLSERGLCFLGLRRFDDAWADVERGRALARGAAEIPRFEVSKLGFVGAQAEAGRGDLARALRTANAALAGLGPEPPGARGTKLEAALRAWIAQRQSAEGRFRG